MDYLVRIVLGAILLFCGVQDILKQKIKLWSIVIGCLVVTFCIPFLHTVTLLDRIGGLSIGLFVVIISLATKGKIGLGDGLLLCITGIGLGLWSNLELFTIALFGAAIISILLLMFGLVNRKKSIPFVPFLFLSYLFIILVPAK